MEQSQVDLNHVIWPATAAIKNGQLELGGCRTTDIVHRFGSPIFVLDEADFRERVSNWRDEFSNSFGSVAGEVYYAAKAFISVEVAKIINECGIGLDVCTGGELAVAKAANFPGSRMELHGNNKSEVEIRAAIDHRVKTIVIDSQQEIARVARIAHEKGVTQDVMLRLNPGVEAHTHEFIATAHEDVKFGFSIASGSAWEAILEVTKHESLRLLGLHAHIGSQIFVVDGFAETATRLIAVLARYQSEFGVALENLDLGGGFGIAYTSADNPLSANEILPKLQKIIAEECSKSGIGIPRISIEPGRALIGPSMVTLYRVGTTKEVELESGKNRLYISVDGGMSDNIRTALYGAEYTATIADRVSTAKVRDCRVVGKHCETGDIIINSIELPGDIAPGDILAVPATGAYGRSMASNYNHVPRPGVISVLNGMARTIVRSETEADLLALDVVEPAEKLGS